MNSKIHPLAAVLVILLTILAIGVWVWGSGEAKEIGGPAGLRIDPRGHLFIQIQEQLLEHDVNGVFLQRHELNKLGVERVLGAFAFFSNGDILIRRGPDPRSLGDNLRAYQRKTNEESLTPLTADTGLHRCDLSLNECSVFGIEAIDFKSAHNLFIDWTTDDVYVSDTTRHLLRKYSSSGEPLAEPVGGFQFPNHLLLHEDQLYVADTNNHRIRIVNPRNDTFGEELDTIDVVPDDARQSRQTWPTHLASIGNNWWVNNMRSTMSEGGIYLFDRNWIFERQVSLPAGADPISITGFRDEVLVSDWNNDRVHRISSAGEVLGDFSSVGLQQTLSESRQERRKFQMYGYSGIVIFFLTIVGLLVRGLATTMSAEPAKKKAPREDRFARVTDELTWFNPDPKTVHKMEMGMRIALSVIVLTDIALTAAVFYLGNLELAIKLLLPLALMTLIFIPISRISRANVNTAIGVRRGEVTLRDHNGIESTCTMKDVFYDSTAIATKDMAAFFGKPQMPIYDPEVLESHLFPLLADAQRVSVWTMQKRLFHIRHPHGILRTLLVITLIAISIVTLIWFVTNQ